MSLDSLEKCFLTLVLSILSALAIGQEAPNQFVRRPIAGFESKEPPVLDGDLGDAVWKLAPKAETFVDRALGGVVTDQSFAYIVYDSQYIYVAFDCRDSQPDLVHARETIRDSKYSGGQMDESPNKEDNVTFSIDPYFSKKSGDISVFSVNALGTPSAQIAGGRANKLEWKGNWESAAKRTPTGYTVEMRIPWVMLNYPNSGKPCTMGVNFFRYQYHTKVESCWSNVTSHGFSDLEGVWSGVSVPQSNFRPKLSLLPYVLPGVGDKGLTFRSGLDARMPITPDLTYVGSLNPDFNTIEGAVEGIAFSRTERFIPERRPFFLEGQDYFNPTTRFNDIGAFLYARRIDTFDLGTKVYGKISPVDSIGVLNTITFGKRSDTAIRYKRDLTPTSEAGFFVSQKSSQADNNSLGLVDWHSRYGAFGFEAILARAWGPGADGGAVVLSSNYQRGNNTSLLQYHTVSSQFQISDGFIPYIDYHGFFGFTDFNGPWHSGAWRNYDYGSYIMAWDHLDGSRYQRSFGNFASLTSKADWRVSFSQDYAIVDDTVDSTYMLSYTNGASNRFRKWGLSLTTGRLASMPATFISPSLSLRLFRHLDLAYQGSILNLDGVTRQHVVTVGYELSPTRSFGARMVSQDDDTNWYVSYRNSGGKGTNLYLILGDPNARTFRRQFQVKLVFAF